MIRIEQGYLDGSSRMPLTYWSIEYLDGGFGIDLWLCDNLVILIHLTYRLLDYGTAEYDNTSVAVEYIGTATWLGKLGILYRFVLE